MEWRETSTGKSIFDSEEKALGRSLTTLEKARVISRYVAIIVLICLSPFFSADLWESSQLYLTPIERSYIDVDLLLGGGGKSPPVIVLTKGGKRIFVSPCDGLNESVCREEYSGESTFVDLADVIEIFPGKGIIKRINMSDKFGKKTVVTNQYAETWVQNYPRNPYQKNWFLLMVSGGAVLAFLALKTLSVIINLRSREQ